MALFSHSTHRWKLGVDVRWELIYWRIESKIFEGALSLLSCSKPWGLQSPGCLCVLCSPHVTALLPGGLLQNLPHYQLQATSIGFQWQGIPCPGPYAITWGQNTNWSMIYYQLSDQEVPLILLCRAGVQNRTTWKFEFLTSVWALQLRSVGRWWRSVFI